MLLLFRYQNTLHHVVVSQVVLVEWGWADVICDRYKRQPESIHESESNRGTYSSVASELVNRAIGSNRQANRGGV